jgi:hypothetical protein
MYILNAGTCTIKNITGNLGTRPLICAFFNFPGGGGAASSNVTMMPPIYVCVDSNNQQNPVTYDCDSTTEGEDICIPAYSTLSSSATLGAQTDCPTTGTDINMCTGYFPCQTQGVTPSCPIEVTTGDGTCVMLPTAAAING